MKSTQGQTEKELAERQQLDKALAESRSEAPDTVAPTNGAHVPRLVRALQDRRERNGMGFYDQYVQAAKDEPSAKPRKPALDDLSPASFRPEEPRRWASTRRNGHTLEEPVNGYAAQPPHGDRPAPHGPRPTAGARMPAVLTTDDSVFTLLLDQVKDLRRQKRELQGIIAEQEEKIFELIGLVHQLKNHPETIFDPSHHSDEDDDR